MRKSLVFVLLICGLSRGQDLKTMILAAGRAGVVELIDPATLQTVGRVHFDFPQRNAGLNGVTASADGSTLYVEGPIPSGPGGCCVLYSVDLATLRTEVVASFSGTDSRNAFVTSGGVTYKTVALTSNETVRDLANDRFHLSPDGHWLFGVQNFRGPALDIYDVIQGRVVRQFLLPNQDGNAWTDGAWSGDRFYLFAGDNIGPGRSWTLTPQTVQLDAGIAVEAFDQVAGCRHPALMGIVSAGDSIFLYETFGSTLDRRDGCGRNIPGGAHRIDPATGQFSGQIAPDLHFSTLLPDPDGTTLYGCKLVGSCAAGSIGCSHWPRFAITPAR